MAVVIQGLSDDIRLAFVVSPLAELGCALQILAQAERDSADVVWAIDAISSAEEGDLAALRRYTPLFAGMRLGLFLTQATGRIGVLTEEIRGLDTVPEAEILASVVIALAGGSRPRTVVSTSDVVRPEHLHEVRQTVAARDDGGLALLDQCRADPVGWLKDFTTFLSRCERWFFRPLWEDVMPLLSAEVQTRRRVARNSGDTGALLSAIDGAHETGVSGVVRMDKLYESTINVSRTGMVICVPSALGGRHLAVKDELSPPVLHYPLPVPHNRPAPSARLVTDRLLALGNLTRLALCRDLLRQPRTTRELSERWNMDAAQVSRHLKVLRDVGLVSIERRGRLVFYRLNSHEVTPLGQDVMDSLLR